MSIGGRKLSKALKRGLPVAVQTPGAGVLKAKARRSGMTVANGTGSAAGAGTASFTLRFTKRARTSLKRAKTVRLAVAVTFTLKDGTASKRTVEVTLHR